MNPHLSHFHLYPIFVKLTSTKSCNYSTRLLFFRPIIMAIEDSVRKIIVHSLSKISEFDGYKKFDGVVNPEHFKEMMKKDPAFSPFSLDRDKYVIARIGGNLITSIHRKLGDLYEEIIIELLHEKYKFEKSYLKYSLDIVIDGKEQERTTDGRIILSDVQDIQSREKVEQLIIGDYEGLALEVRSCYQIGDSKRIQADEHMATALKQLNVEPKLVIMCNTSLVSPVKRLKKHWTVYQGKESFDFIHQLTDFNLYDFLMDNQNLIVPLMDDVFEML